MGGVVLGAANVQLGGQPQSWRYDRRKEEDVLWYTESISMSIVLFRGGSSHTEHDGSIPSLMGLTV